MARIYINSLRQLSVRDGYVFFDLGEERQNDEGLVFESQVSAVMSARDCRGIVESALI